MFFLLNWFTLVLKATHLIRLHRFKYNSPRRVSKPIPERRIVTIIQLFISILQFTWLTFASLEKFPKVCSGGVTWKGAGKHCNITKRENVKVKTIFALTQHGKVAKSQNKTRRGRESKTRSPKRGVRNEESETRRGVRNETRSPKRDEESETKRGVRNETRSPKRNEESETKRGVRNETRSPKRNEESETKRGVRNETSSPKRNEESETKRGVRNETRSLKRNEESETRSPKRGVRNEESGNRNPTSYVKIKYKLQKFRVQNFTIAIPRSEHQNPQSEIVVQCYNQISSFKYKIQDQLQNPEFKIQKS